MARGVNRVTLVGHLGKDPEMRSTTGGTIIAQFSLATSERRKDQQGNYVDATEWHNLVAFNRTAEIARDYLKKGSQVYIEGKIQTRSWDGNDGNKHYRTEILVNELVLLGAPVQEDYTKGNAIHAKGANGQPMDQPTETRRPAQGSLPVQSAKQPPMAYSDALEITDDDIPF